MINVIGDFANIEGQLRNQDHIGAARDTSGERNPACVASHHFTHHHAVMAIGSGVQSIERFGCSVDSGQEAECDFRSNKIVVNRLRHSDDIHARSRERRRARHRAIATDHDKRIHAIRFNRAETAVHDILENR